ncbi:MAG TPA: hypothetical protein VGS19_12325 [Streptosporangiaceae bacterium]|nr:hypothetical protein [Streptosporangiaceae bacterium]
MKETPMINDETEEVLRGSFTQAAAEFGCADLAHHRLIQRKYLPVRGNHRLAALTAAAAAVALAAGLGVYGALGSSPSSAAALQPGSGKVTHKSDTSGSATRLAAFSIVSNSNGTVTVIANPRRVFDPTALQRALAQHGIPAVVRIGSECYSQPAPNSNNVFPGEGNGLVIDPSGLPAGTEIGFGYFGGNQLIVGDVMDTTAHTCTADLSQIGSLLFEAYWPHRGH